VGNNHGHTKAGLIFGKDEADNDRSLEDEKMPNNIRKVLHNSHSFFWAIFEIGDTLLIEAQRINLRGASNAR
jgi:hypothetical protein